MYKIRVYICRNTNDATLNNIQGGTNFTYDNNRTSWQDFEQSIGIFILPFSLTYKVPSTATALFRTLSTPSLA